MTAKDYRIEDWVLYLGKKHRINSGDLVSMELESNTDIIDKVFQPIPITPDILEKNGFEFDGEKYYELEELEFVKVDSGYSLSINWDEYRFGKDFKCVHELQHIMEIYGIENEIKL